jgi:hypothetical protein
MLSFTFFNSILAVFYDAGHERVAYVVNARVFASFKKVVY